jgi:hypothetical protein
MPTLSCFLNKHILAYSTALYENNHGVLTRYHTNFPANQSIGNDHLIYFV